MEQACKRNLNRNVDDILLACSSALEINNVISSLNNMIDVIDRGPISFYLGIENNRDGPRGSIYIFGRNTLKRNMTNWACGTVLKKAQIIVAI